MEINLYNIMSVCAFIMSIGGNTLINKQIKWGFVIWGVSNIAWIIVNVISVQTNWIQIAMFIVYTMFNIHGFVSWSKKKNKTGL